MRRSYLGRIPWCWGAIALAMATSAFADPYRARSNAGFAPPDAVFAAVGHPQLEIVCPPERVEQSSEMLGPNPPDRWRGAKVTLVQSGVAYRDTAVMDSILVGALQGVWQQCPMQQMNAVGDRYEQNDVGFVDIYGRLTDDGPQIRLVHADRFLSTMGIWAHVTDEGAAQELHQAAIAEPQPSPSPQPRQLQFIAPPQPQSVTQPALAPAASTRTFNDDVSDFFDAVGRFIRNVLLVILVLVVFFNRANILRFLYGLTPHPASGEVKAAIYSGQRYDPVRLMRALEVVPANPIEREVRMKQGAELLRELNLHRANIEKEFKERAEYMTSQTDLSDSMMAHARIKSLLDALLRAQGNSA